MKLAYSILYVEDVTKTVEFYNTAFGFETKFITPESDYAELITGETTLAFASHELGRSNFKKGFEASSLGTTPFGFELAFTSENIQSDFETAVKAGASIYEPLVQKPWGQTVGCLRDLNGFLIEVCTPIKNS
ncbi:MAG: VOC family protein [Flavobacteriales bacterium]|nr:VOC family protein [Flavobacteriales bacterium]